MCARFAFGRRAARTRLTFRGVEPMTSQPMTQRSLGSKQWELAAALLPGALVFCFMMLTSERPVFDRILSALVQAFVVQLGGLFGFVLATAVVAQLGKYPMDTLPVARDLIGGALLFVTVWIWWQHNKDVTVRQIAFCVEDAMRDDSSIRARTAVLECYRQPPKEFAPED